MQTSPGMTGLTVGENELGPPGPPAFFSVGLTSGADAGADDGVEVVFGSSLVVLLQPASTPIATTAEPPIMRVT